MTDPDGKPVDPRQVSSSPFDPRNFSSPDDVAKAVAYANANISDSNMRRQVEDQIYYLGGKNRQVENEQHQQAKQQLDDYFAQHGTIAGAPSDLVGQFRPAELEEYHTSAPVAKNDPQTEIDFLTGKTELTPDNVKDAYAKGKLSPAGWVDWTRAAEKQQNEPQKDYTPSMNSSQLSDILTMNQLTNLVNPKDDASKIERVQLETAINNEINRQQDQAKRKLTWDEKANVARSMVIDKVYTQSDMFGQANKGLKPVAIATPEELKNATVWVGDQKVRLNDIPQQYRTQALQDLSANKVPTTRANIAAWWIKKGRPAQ